ncbi:MAG: FAD-dependent oxidoreductase, partial [Anaerolineales bacterium]
YVVKDPQAARECIEENRILRKIMPQCIEDTGGFFVVTPWDGPEYAPMFVEGCHKAGIPVEEVPVSQMLREEPLLNPNISRCYRVPDAAADSWLAADLNARSAQEYGSTVLRYHKVIGLLREGDQVVGAACHDLVNDEEVSILADFVVNACGAWAGQVAASIDVPVHIVPGKGVMLAANHRILHTVVNRCKMPSDGDILVPIHTVTVIGTTDVKVSDPDHFAIQPWEVRLMLDEGEKLVPGFKDMRMLRAWAGVRPLYQETVVSDTRDITRAYVLLDHEQR